tara:strand:+ start:317 stop:547 length:231 start_codon:yes stop_codon:yes gene_type:complete
MCDITPLLDLDQEKEYTTTLPVAFHIFMTNQKTGLGKFVMLWLLLVNCPASFYYHGTCCKLPPRPGQIKTFQKKLR